MTLAIPLIPAAPLLDPAADGGAAAARLAAAATGPGFAVLTGADAALGLDPALRARLLSVFALPEARLAALARRKFVPANRNVYRGVFLAQPGHATWKRGIDIGPDLLDPARADPADPLTEPTPLPAEAEAPGWRGAAATYYRAMQRLGLGVIAALAGPLGLDAARLLPHFAGGISTLRLLDYPERLAASLPADGSADAGPGEARAVVGAPHCDNGFVTLLWQDAQGGLQARGAAGGWVEVPPVADGLAVNFGRLLADLTGGRVRATEHRVLGGLAARRSIPFFLEPAVDAPVALPDGSARAYGDLLWERMAGFVEFRGVARRPAA